MLDFTVIHEFFNRNIFWVKGGCLVALLTHFVLIFIYISPLTWFSNELKHRAHSYSSPLFYQGWRVFAPVPTEKSTLMVRYFDNGKWSDEIYVDDILGEERHFATQRIIQKGGFYLGAQIKDYSQESEDPDIKFKVVKSSLAYFKAAHVCKQSMERMYGLRPDSMEVVLERTLFPRYGTNEVKKVKEYMGVESLLKKKK